MHTLSVNILNQNKGFICKSKKHSERTGRKKYDPDETQNSNVI